MMTVKNEKKNKLDEEEIKKKAIEEYIAQQNKEQEKSESDADSAQS